MKILVLLLSFVQVVRADLRTTLDLKGGERICLGGDSITHAQMYSSYLMAWFQLTYPDLDLETYSIAQSGSSLPGWYGAAPGSTAPPVVSLYEQYIYPFDPDIVFLMHGHNGGQTVADHGATYSKLWTDWVDGQSGAKLVMLGMHPTQAATDNKSAKEKADAEATLAATSPRIFSSHTYNQMGAQWLSNSENTIDVQQIGVKPFTTSGQVVNDSAARVHPGPAGHIAIAWAALKRLGAESVVSQATINAATATVASSTNCTISGISGNSSGVSFSRLDKQLPWAVDEAGRANAIRLYPEIAGWQDYSLKVTGLNPGSYEIRCDGEVIGTATDAQLAAGWNMADLTRGPVWRQSQQVLSKIRELEGFDPVTGDSLAGNANAGTVGDIFDYKSVNYTNGGQRGATYKASMAPKIAALSTKMMAVQAAAQPVTRTYTVTPGKAWNYVGVPYPDWEYDPFTTAAPQAPGEWPAAARAGYYYVAKDTAGATDAWDGSEPRDANNRRYGYPARPRLTLPTSNANTNTYPAGSIVWIKGGTFNTAYGSFKDWTGEWQGTAQKPCWIYGDPTDPPKFGDVRISLYASRYVFVDGIIWDGGATGGSSLSINRNDKNGQSHHITVRHCTVINRPYQSHGSHFSVVGPATGTGGADADIHDVVFYRNSFANNGIGVDFNQVDADVHGYKINGQWGGNRAYRIWLIEDVVTPGTAVDPTDGFRKSLAGNYAQIGDQLVTQGNVDHVYIAGAKTEGMRQGCVGLKRCGHVVVSSNSCKNLLQTSTSQGQAFNTKYDRQENQWFVNNTVDHCDAFIIRAEATSSGAGGADTFSPADTRVYIIGNVFKDCMREPFNAPDAGGIGGWKTKGISIQEMRGKCYIANNLINESVYGVYFAPLPGRQSTGSEMHVYNNIVTRLRVGADTSTAANNAVMVTTDTGTTKFYVENNLSDSGRFYFAGTQYSSAAQFNARNDAAGNVGGDPLFSNPTTGDYSLKAGSPAIDAGTQSYTTNTSSDVYQLFVSAFANDPDFPGSPADVWPQDRTGGARVRGARIDIGPFESGGIEIPSGGVVEGVSRASGLKVKPKEKAAETE
ncbi:MAG: hypothetical protein V4640_02885 [Verrucomicrobiota bacterium]